jgi:hypothetical protein
LGDVKETAMDKVLKSFYALLEKLRVGKEFADIPGSLYLLEKCALQDTAPMHSALLDICPIEDHYVFPADSKEQTCPFPGCNRPRDSERQMMVGGIDTLLQELYKIPEIAEVCLSHSLTLFLFIYIYIYIYIYYIYIHNIYIFILHVDTPSNSLIHNTYRRYGIQQYGKKVMVTCGMPCC